MHWKMWISPALSCLTLKLLQPVLRHDQLARLPSRSFPQHQKSLAVRTQPERRHRTRARELRHREQDPLLSHGEGPARGDLGRYHLGLAVDVEQFSPIVRPCRLTATGRGQLPFGRRGLRERPDIDLELSRFTRRVRQPPSIRRYCRE